MGLIEDLEETKRFPLSRVRDQLIAIARDLDKASGVVKKFLPDGRLEITNKAGTRIIRPPYSWEIEGN